MKKLRNIATGVTVGVKATTDHPSSSYGKKVWVDKNKQAYCEVGKEAPFYEIID